MTLSLGAILPVNCNSGRSEIFIVLVLTEGSTDRSINAIEINNIVSTGRNTNEKTNLTKKR